MKARFYCFMVFVWLLAASVLVGCTASPEAVQGEPWVLGKPLLIQGCEDLKERDKDANC